MYHVLVTLQVSKVEKVGDMLTLSLAANTEQGVPQVVTDINCLLWAIGRDANLVNLGLDTTGTCTFTCTLAYRYIMLFNTMYTNS